MSEARVVVLEVVSGHLSVTAAARVYGLSRQHIYRLVNRYQQGGLEAVDPRSRRPASNPPAVAGQVFLVLVEKIPESSPPKGVLCRRFRGMRSVGASAPTLSSTFCRKHQRTPTGATVSTNRTRSCSSTMRDPNRSQTGLVLNREFEPVKHLLKVFDAKLERHGPSSPGPRKQASSEAPVA